MKQTIVLAMLTVILAGCGSAFLGENGTLVEVPAITAVTHSPAVVHAGDTVLISYLVGRDTARDEGGGYLPLANPPELFASAGEITALTEGIYRPGGQVPDFAEAETAFDNVSEHGDSRSKIRRCYQEPYYYMLYKAPSSPQTVQIEFYIGGGGGPESPKARHTLNLEVH